MDKEEIRKEIIYILSSLGHSEEDGIYYEDIEEATDKIFELFNTK